MTGLCSHYETRKKTGMIWRPFFPGDGFANPSLVNKSLMFWKSIKQISVIFIAESIERVMFNIFVYRVVRSRDPFLMPEIQPNIFLVNVIFNMFFAMEHMVKMALLRSQTVVSPVWKPMECCFHVWCRQRPKFSLSRPPVTWSLRSHWVCLFCTYKWGQKFDAILGILWSHPYHVQIFGTSALAQASSGVGGKPGCSDVQLLNQRAGGTEYAQARIRVVPRYLPNSLVQSGESPLPLTPGGC